MTPSEGGRREERPVAWAADGPGPDALQALLGGQGLDALCRLTEFLPEGALIADPEGRILFWNGAAERLTGHLRAAVLGRHCGEVMGEGEPACNHAPGEGRCGVVNGVRHARCGGLRTRDGRDRVVFKNAVAIHGADGSCVGVLEIFSDVTDVPGVCCQAPERRPAVLNEGDFARLVGRHPVMQDLYRVIGMVSRSDATVLVLGESGTGKELVAEAIHGLSARAGEPFVRVNCSALNENLLESELFGHVRGAFTGASRDRVGRFEEAHRGVLLLDEIGDVTPAVQVKLLRVLERREVEKVGSSKPVPVDVRLLCATHRDLRALVDEGRFRADLFFRLNVYPLRVPALREHLADLPLLAGHLLARLNAAPAQRVTDEALALLAAYPWPGNVRELAHAVQYAALHAAGADLRPEHFPLEVRAGPVFARPLATSDSELRREIVGALERSGFSRDLAARALGISRVTLWKHMKRLEIGAPVVRSRPRSRR